MSLSIRSFAVLLGEAMTMKARLAAAMARFCCCLILTGLALTVSTAGAQERNLDQTYEKAESFAWGDIYRQIFNRSGFGKSYALVIGIGDYEHWSDLKASLADATRVRDHLINEAGFDYVVTLTNARATKSRVEKLMLEYFPSVLGKDDRFLFYFSGHGTQRKIGDEKIGYLPLQNATETGYADMISMEDVQRWSRLVGQSRQSLFVLDSCFSGLAGVQRKSPLQTKQLQRLSQPGHHLITAGTENEESFASMSRWGGSLFTDAFLKGIAGEADASTAAFGADGIVSIKELVKYIEDRIDSEPDQIKMSPQISELRSDNAGEFFFLTKSYKNRAFGNTETADLKLGMPETKGGGMQVAALPQSVRLLTDEQIRKYKIQVPPPVETFRDCPDCPIMVRVPPGEFQFGAVRYEHLAFNVDEDDGAREMPRQNVNIGYGFAVGQREVTRREFLEFVEATGRSSDGCFAWNGTGWVKQASVSWRNPGFSQSDLDPAVCVSWKDAKAYVEWLAGKTGKAYRLLSATEWEYVARANTQTARYWGDDHRLRNECFYANGADEMAADMLNLPPTPGRIFMCRDRHAYTAPVASFVANGFGLHDVIGNASEWTEDCFRKGYDGAPLDGSAWTRSRCERRTLRGGSWFSLPNELRAARNGRNEIAVRRTTNGLRVACTLDPQGTGCLKR